MLIWVGHSNFTRTKIYYCSALYRQLSHIAFPLRMMHFQADFGIIPDSTPDPHSSAFSRNFSSCPFYFPTTGREIAYIIHHTCFFVRINAASKVANLENMEVKDYDYLRWGCFDECQGEWE
jgi:hypothetical protein